MVDLRNVAYAIYTNTVNALAVERIEIQLAIQNKEMKNKRE